MVSFIREDLDMTNKIMNLINDINQNLKENAFQTTTPRVGTFGEVILTLEEWKQIVEYIEHQRKLVKTWDTLWQDMKHHVL